MTNQRENTTREDTAREVWAACRVFRATLLEIAERATLEAVQAMVQRAQIYMTLAPQTGDAPPAEERSPPDRLTRLDAQIRILQLVRKTPGSTARELANELGVTKERLQYHLRLLMANGTLESHDVRAKNDHLLLRQYFCRSEVG